MLNFLNKWKIHIQIKRHFNLYFFLDGPTLRHFLRDVDAHGAAQREQRLAQNAAHIQTGEVLATYCLYRAGHQLLTLFREFRCVQRYRHYCSYASKVLMKALQ